MLTQIYFIFALAAFSGVIHGFSPSPLKASRLQSSMFAEKVAQEVTGEELELMLEEWEQPLLLDAYATWVRFIRNHGSVRPLCFHVSYILFSC